MSKARFIYVLVLATLAYGVFAAIAWGGPHEGGEI